MHEDRINLLIKKDPLKEGKRRKPFFLFSRFTIIVIILTTILGVSISLARDTKNDPGHPSFFGAVQRLVTSGDKTLDGEDGDRINVLILGIGGAGHDGPELTDTIILSSVRPSTGEVGMLSIPRDLSVPIPGYGWRKINSVNAYGEQDNPGHGAELASQSISEIFDQPIPYWVKVDFRGFEEFIDAIGGVDVNIERSFDDPTYPIDDDLGSTIALSFTAGEQHLDGATALQYVRSRHGNNGEGSDFARAARQQKVILSIKKKVLSAGTLLNPARLTRIIDTLKGNIQTNIGTWEILRLANVADLFVGQNISNNVLTTAPGSPLYDTYVNGAYVILPRNNDWTPLQTIAKNIFDPEAVQHVTSFAPERDITIEIQNATNIPGLASATADHLSAQGFTIASFGNTNGSTRERSIIYDLSGGAHHTELIALQDYLSADISISSPGWLLNQDLVPDELTVTDTPVEALTDQKNIDFLIILGDHSANVLR